MNEEIQRMIEIRARLKEIADRHVDPKAKPDIEADHVSADQLMGELLSLYGESDAVINFRAIRKWYA